MLRFIGSAPSALLSIIALGLKLGFLGSSLSDKRGSCWTRFAGDL